MDQHTVRVTQHQSKMVGFAKIATQQMFRFDDQQAVSRERVVGNGDLAVVERFSDYAQEFTTALSRWVADVRRHIRFHGDCFASRHGEDCADERERADILHGLSIILF